jgi:hypothetical protein
MRSIKKFAVAGLAALTGFGTASTLAIATRGHHVRSHTRAQTQRQQQTQTSQQQQCVISGIPGACTSPFGGSSSSSSQTTTTSTTGNTQTQAQSQQQQQSQCLVVLLMGSC